MRKRIDLPGLVKLDRDYPTDASCVRKLADFQVFPEFPEILLLDVSRFVRFRNQHFDVFHDFLVRQSDAVKLVKDLPKLRHIFGSVEQSVLAFSILSAMSLVCMQLQVRFAVRNARFSVLLQTTQTGVIAHLMLQLPSCEFMNTG